MKKAPDDIPLALRKAHLKNTILFRLAHKNGATAISPKAVPIIPLINGQNGELALSNCRFLR